MPPGGGGVGVISGDVRQRRLIVQQGRGLDADEHGSGVRGDVGQQAPVAQPAQHLGGESRAAGAVRVVNFFGKSDHRLGLVELVRHRALDVRGDAVGGHVGKQHLLVRRRQRLHGRHAFFRTRPPVGGDARVVGGCLFAAEEKQQTKRREQRDSGRERDEEGAGGTGRFHGKMGLGWWENNQGCAKSESQFFRSPSGRPARMTRMTPRSRRQMDFALISMPASAHRRIAATVSSS